MVTIFAVLILMIISISTFLAYGHSYAWTYDPDPVVLALVWTLAVVQALRSILIIAEPMLKSKGLLQDGTKTQTFRMFSTPSHALLTLTMRFASIVMIIVATVDKRFSHGDCNMWS